MFTFAVVIMLLLSSNVLAESQEDLYFKALKAEEKGEILESILFFENAVKLEGNYTDEINEILNQYYDALDIKEKNNFITYRFLGDIGFYGLKYEEYGGVESVSEYGGDIFTSVGSFLDFHFGDWVHSFGIAFVADWFISNKEMPVLDTCDWNLASGLEYSLVWNSLLVDIGIDFNARSGESVKPSFYGWLEYSFIKKEESRFGGALLTYLHAEGPTTLALYGIWNKSKKIGFNALVYAGVKYEADSLANILSYIQNFNIQEGVKNEPNLMDKPIEYYIDKCSAEYGKKKCNENLDLVELYINEDYFLNDIFLESYWTRWLGPSLNFSISYKFKNNLSLEGKLNAFYGFVIDGVSKDYDNLQKFSGNWGLLCSYSLSFLTFYLGAEQYYVHYNMPFPLEGIYPENSFLKEVKAGIKFEI